MNLPNKLTVLRMILIIPFVILLLNSHWLDGKALYVSLVIFIVASFTDFLDGNIARKRNLVTNFGKFMDPLADKLLVCSALICFIEMDRIPAWIVLIIIAREFIISGFRLVAAEAGIVIAAGIWGKAKTVIQMIMIIIMIPNLTFNGIVLIEQILIYASLILTVISLIDYIAHNKNVLLDGGKI